VSLLAAIGQVESGNLAGRRIDHRHRAVPPVLGPVLDGAGFAAIRDTDHGRWDGDPVWDRAVGPMQFIPGTWQRFGVDGDSDGVADPQDIEDAAASAAKYLCFGGRDLSTPVGVRSAVLSYNHSGSYLALVLRWMNTFEDHGFHSVVSTVTTTSPSPSSHGGPVVIRHHGTLNAHAGRPRKHKPKHARHPARHPRPPSGTPTDIPTTQPPPAPSPDPGPTTGPTTGPEPSPGPTPSSSCTPDPTPDSSPDSSPSASPSDTPTASPAPTADPTATPSADPTASPTVDPTTADPCATATTSPETGARGTAAAAHRAAGGSSSGRKPTRLSNDQPPVRTRERGRSRQRSRRSAE
jgi:hypothetical protein